MAYASPRDVTQFALPAAALKPTPRIIESVEPTTGVFTLSSHGLVTGDLLRFSIEGQAPLGATPCALPAGLALATMYAATVVSADLFNVALVGGSVLTSFGDAGTPPFAIVVDQSAAILAGLDLWSGIVDNAVISHAAPTLVNPTTGKYHPNLIFANAYLFARAAFSALGLANPQYAQAAADFTSGAIGKLVDGWLEAWARGVPLYPAPPDQTPAIIENGARARADARPTCWRTGAL